MDSSSFNTLWLQYLLSKSAQKNMDLASTTEMTVHCTSMESESRNEMCDSPLPDFEEVWLHPPQVKEPR
jgi:hypothetical protein